MRILLSMLLVAAVGCRASEMTTPVETPRTVAVLSVNPEPVPGPPPYELVWPAGFVHEEGVCPGSRAVASRRFRSRIERWRV